MDKIKIPEGWRETNRANVQISAMEGDPARRMAKVLDDDMLRIEIRGRAKALTEEYRRTFNCDPTWVRVSFDLVYRNYGPVFTVPCTINGLTFILDLTYYNRVEVGSSAYDQRQDKPSEWVYIRDNP